MLDRGPRSSRRARWIAAVLIVQLGSGFWWTPAAVPETFFVSPAGSDANAGTAADPFRSITRALAESPVAGDVIDVAAGTYDSSVETFPLFLVDGVHLRGAGRDVTTIEAPNGQIAFENTNTPLASTTTLSGFTVQSDASSATAASSPLMRLDLEEELTADVAMSPTIRDNRFRRGLGAIHSRLSHENLAPTYAPLIQGNTFSEVSAFTVDTFTETFTSGTEVFTTTFTTTTSVPAIYVDALEGEQLGGRIANTISGNTFSGVIPISVEISPTTHQDVEIDVKVSDNVATRGALPAEADFLDFAHSMEGDTDSTATVKLTVRGNRITGFDEVFELDFEAESEASFSGSFVISGNVGEEIDRLLDFEHTSISDRNDKVTLLISGNTYSTSFTEDDALYVAINDLEESGVSEDSVVADVRIVNNRLTSEENETGDDVNGLDLDIGSELNLSTGRVGNYDVLVAGNTVSGFETGLDISLSDVSGENVDLRLQVQGNAVSGAGYRGLELDLFELEEIPSSAVSFQISDNAITGNAQWGAVVDVGDVSTDVEFGCNLVEGNDTDPASESITIEGSPAGFRPGGGVLVETDDLGRAVFGEEELGGDNVLSANTANGGFDVYNQTPSTIRARNNFWGTTDTETIEENIFDRTDDPTFGEVEFVPIRSTSPSVTVDVTLDDQIVSSSPTIIEYTATITGAGDCGAAGGSFSAAIPSNGTIVEGSLTVSPEESAAVFGEDPIDVQVGHVAPGDVIVVTWQVVVDPDEERVESQGTVDSPQTGPVDSRDPDGGGPTVTFLDVVSIPTLGPFAVGLLSLLLTLSAVAVMRRGYGAAALLLVSSLLVVGGARALEEREARSPRQGSPERAERAEREPASPPAELVALGKHANRVIGGGRLGGGLARMTLADGAVLEVRRDQLDLEDKRSREVQRAMAEARQARREGTRVASAATAVLADWRQAVRAGGGVPVVLEVKTDRDSGRVRKVKVEVFDDLAAAEAAVAGGDAAR